MGSARDVGRDAVVDTDTVDGMGTVEARRLVRGACGAGWTSVEALRPEDGLALWAYEPHLLLNAVACGAGTVFVSTRVAHERDREEPAQIVALSASDGVALWRMRPEQLRWRLLWPRVACFLRVAFGQFSLTSAWWAVRSLRLAGCLSLTADGDLLLACAGSVLFAFDAAMGALRWVTPPLLYQDRRVLAVRSGRIYVAGERGGIEALDARTGTRRWAAERLGAPLCVAAGDALVYVHASKRGGPFLATLRAEDGTQLRTHALRAGLRAGEDEEWVVALTDDGVAVLLRDRQLQSIRLDDGEVLWRSGRLEAMREDAAGRPVSVPQVAVAGRHLAYAYTAFDGTARTRTLHVGALDTLSGASLWKWHGPERPWPLQGSQHLVVAFGNVYLSTHDGAYAFGGDGRALWTTPPGFDVAFIGTTLAEAEHTR
jgi:outer membrane protein assembly factor BamB